MRQPTIQELLRDKMNDKDYNPTSNIVPDLHHSFSEPRDLSYEGCMNGMDVTAEQCKERLADTRVKVYKISADYNVSGNGDGNLIDEDTEWVQLETTDPNYSRWDRALYKDDNRADFCRHFGEVIAYVWDEWDRNDFLKSVFA